MSRETIIDNYINELKANIGPLSSSEQKEVVEFYREFLLDSSLQTREDINNELGSSKKLARKILADYSIANDEVEEPEEEIKQPKKILKKNTNIKTIWIILIGLLAIPTAIPAAITLAGIVFAAFAVIVGIFIGFLGLIAGLIIGGLYILFKGLLVWGISWSVGMFYVGSGITLSAIGLLIMPGAYVVIKYLGDLTTKFVRFIGKKFFNKQYYKAKEEK